jgi:hypothetical protein
MLAAATKLPVFDSILPVHLMLLSLLFTPLREYLMKTQTASVLTCGFLLFFFYSCRQEEYPSSAIGRVSFSLSQFTKSDGKVHQPSTPAYVTLSIEDSHDNVRELIKLQLYNFGQGYVSEHLELPVGNYKLTHFEVWDESDKIIYAAPLEGSEHASFVTHPLPMSFTIRNNYTQITTQVLAVADTIQTPNVDLDIRLQYPALTHFDSAYIVFKNSSSEIKYNLSLDNSSHVASAHVTAIACGEWKISTSYFSTIKATYKSLEKTAAVDITINPTATDLISIDNTVFVEDNTDSINVKSLIWEEYYYYQLYSAQKLEGFTRLPKDPTNPFVEISIFESKWIYVFTSRSFYNRSLDGNSNYHQGSCAFELYGKSGDTHDLLEKHIIDTTSLKPGILKVKDKTWNFVSGFIIMYDNNNNEVLFYYEWDSQTSEDG